MSEAEKGLAARRARKSGRRRGCPLCGKPPVEEHRPFCSVRCKQIDLGRWLGENYRIESEERREGEPTPEEGKE
ncbi:MAG TPA: DNA gyrase inhibitor YacG [Alphaproteobacteria bacterium]|nr:DNA gyrase inhibitor YacG [Alphaproteobacteria bacterium]